MAAMAMFGCRWCHVIVFGADGFRTSMVCHSLYGRRIDAVNAALVWEGESEEL